MRDVTIQKKSCADQHSHSSCALRNPRGGLWGSFSLSGSPFSRFPDESFFSFLVIALEENTSLVIGPFKLH